MARRLLFKSGSKIQSQETDKLKIDASILILENLPTYEGNVEAVADGHPLNAVYKTSTGEIRIVI